MERLTLDRGNTLVEYDERKSFFFGEVLRLNKGRTANQMKLSCRVKCKRDARLPKYSQVSKDRATRYAALLRQSVSVLPFASLKQMDDSQ